MSHITPPSIQFPKPFSAIMSVLLMLLSLPLGASVLGFVEHESTVGGNHDIAISPDGFFLYMADIGGWGSIGIFQRTGNGVLNWVGTVESDVNDDNLHNLNEVTISNTASVSADQMDPDATNDSDTEDTVVGESTDSSDDSDSSGGGGGTDPLSLLVIGTLLIVSRWRRPFTSAQSA